MQTTDGMKRSFSTRQESEQPAQHTHADRDNPPAVRPTVDDPDAALHKQTLANMSNYKIPESERAKIAETVGAQKSDLDDRIEALTQRDHTRQPPAQAEEAEDGAVDWRYIYNKQVTQSRYFQSEQYPRTLL